MRVVSLAGLRRTRGARLSEHRIYRFLRSAWTVMKPEEGLARLKLRIFLRRIRTIGNQEMLGY
jgi:hypothetical protein